MGFLSGVLVLHCPKPRTRSRGRLRKEQNMPYLGFLEYPGSDCHWRSEVGRRMRKDSVLDPVCFARPTMAQSASCRSWSGSCLLRFRTPLLDSPEPLALPRPSATVEQTCQTL